MYRLTTNKDVSEMGMYELAHNCCYIKDALVRYRDFETDIDIRDLARNLMITYGVWKSIEEHGLDGDNELIDDELFDEAMMENLMYKPERIEGLIAVFYRNLWAMADIRDSLKEYEDAEEQGLLLRLPCKVGDTVWFVGNEFVNDYEVRRYIVDETGVDCIQVAKEIDGRDYWNSFSIDDFNKTVFQTKEEAEQALKQMGE